MMKNKFIYIMCFFCSCIPLKKGDQNSLKLIQGKWKHTNPDEIIYPEMDFYNNGEARFFTLSDTILYYGYKVEKNDLLLLDANKVKTRNKIFKLTKDSLIFKTLLWHAGIQAYVRTSQ